MRILQVEPEREPETKDIASSLAAMQEVVNGPIQALFPFEAPVALVCNDEGKLLGLPFNRVLRDGNGNPYDIVCGLFFLCGAPRDSDHFDSLTDEQLETYRELFKRPEMFMCVNGQIVVLPCE